RPRRRTRLRADPRGRVAHKLDRSAVPLHHLRQAARMTLAGRSVLMSGGSRGIGLAIAVRLAREGATVTLLAKTDAPHPRLPGSRRPAGEEIQAAGGGAVGVVGDVRDDEAIARAVATAVETFGGIDVVVNNASVIDLAPTDALDPKRYDLMQDVN